MDVSILHQVIFEWAFPQNERKWDYTFHSLEKEDSSHFTIVPTMLFIPSSERGQKSLEQKVFQGLWDKSVVGNGSNNPFQTLSGVFCHGAHFIRFDLTQH